MEIIEIKAGTPKEFPAGVTPLSSRRLKPASTVSDRVRVRIDACPGPVLLRADFLGLGSESQISRVLAALVKKKTLFRIGHGIYAKARRSSVTGQIIPAGSLETLATAALKRLGIRFGPGSAARAYNARETTQLPGFYVAHTGHRRITRTIEVGGRKLVFEHD